MSVLPYGLRYNCAALASYNEIDRESRYCACCRSNFGNHGRLVTIVEGISKYMCLNCRTGIKNVYLRKPDAPSPSSIIKRIARLHPSDPAAIFVFNLTYSSAVVHMLGNVAIWRTVSDKPMPDFMLLMPREGLSSYMRAPREAPRCSSANCQNEALSGFSSCQSHSPCAICCTPAPINGPRAMYEFGMKSKLPVCFGCVCGVMGLARGYRKPMDALRPILARARSFYFKGLPLIRKVQLLIDARTARMFYAAVMHVNIRATLGR